MASVNTFVPRDGVFVKLEIGSMSFNDMATHLGYHPDQLRFFSNYDDASYYWMAYKIFTNEIIHIATSHDALNAGMVQQYTAAYKANYDSGDIEDILDKGIQNVHCHLTTSPRCSGWTPSIPTEQRSASPSVTNSSSWMAS